MRCTMRLWRCDDSDVTIDDVDATLTVDGSDDNALATPITTCPLPLCACVVT